MLPSVNQTDINQTTMTSILNESSQICQASCSASQTGDVVIIENSTVGGDAGFEIACTVSTSCVMNNTIESEVSNILSAVANQQNSSITGILGDLGNAGQFNYAGINESITNYITQIEESTCSATASFTQSNDLFYAANSSVGGFAGFQIGIAQPASANASCTMTNLSRVVVYNSAQASVTQSNTSVSLFAIIAVAIVACVIIGGILSLKKRSNQRDVLTLYIISLMTIGSNLACWWISTIK